jgi:hypothetical protein
MWGEAIMCFRFADIPRALAWATLPLANAVRITLFRRMPGSWSGKCLKIAEIASRYIESGVIP